MEYCRARRISAADPCAMPSAHAPTMRLTSALVRIESSPAAILFLWAVAQTLCGSLDLGNAAVPVEDLLAVPVQHTLVLVHVVIDLLEVLNPVRLPADVGVDRQRADFRALRAFSVKPIELVDGALEQIVALVVLDQHHRNVVELDRIRQRDERTLGSADNGRLV